MKLRVGLPEETMDLDLEMASTRAIEGWLSLVTRDGNVVTRQHGMPDMMATAYGLFAVTRSLTLLGELVPLNTRDLASRTLKRVVKFLARQTAPDGVDAAALFYASLDSAKAWLDLPNYTKHVEDLREKAEHKLKKALEAESHTATDAGAIGLSLLFFALIDPDNDLPLDKELQQRCIDRCLISTTPDGLFGGGAESSISSLPIPAVFTKLSGQLKGADLARDRILHGWEQGYYDGLLDVNVPWLTPLTYMIAYGLAWLTEDSDPPTLTKPNQIRNLNGSGLLEIGDWLIRLAAGGTIGWLHHIPSNSTRVFGSPSGLALREGPWVIEGDYLYQPTMSGFFPESSSDPWTIAGDLTAVSIPGTERAPRRIGFPSWRGKDRKGETRLIPPLQPLKTKRSQTIEYGRGISLKDGALTIATKLSGRVIHRLPVIWPGGHFGTLRFGKEMIDPGKSSSRRKIREIGIGGGSWPEWTVRFDQNIDVIYEPIHSPVTAHPLRYLSAAVGTIDVIATDRVHMAWRVK